MGAVLMHRSADTLGCNVRRLAILCLGAGDGGSVLLLPASFAVQNRLRQLHTSRHCNNTC